MTKLAPGVRQTGKNAVVASSVMLFFSGEAVDNEDEDSKQCFVFTFVKGEIIYSRRW